MSHHHEGSLPFRSALVCIGLLVSHGMAQSSGIAQTYCSSENTGSDYSPVYDRYQSMGSCSETCRSSYAFAILQGSNCWCSNYIPADQESTSQCSATCPGYPTDLCGNQARGLFGYIALDIKPSGTAGASSQPQSTRTPQNSPSPTSSPDPGTSVAPLSSSAPPYSSSAPPDTTTSSPPSSSSPPGTPVVRTSVITRSGSVVTQTVTTTPIIIPGNDSPATSPMQRGLSGGAIAGIVIGALFGLAALIFAAFLLWRRRKQSDDEDGADSPRPKRTTSVLSRTGLLARKERPTSMAEHHTDNDPYNSNLRNSHLFIGAGASIEPSSPLGGSQDHISSTSRRASRPMVYDQRLNPSALFANPEANGSRVSMQDQQDYSRPLGVANPDFRASFDSR